MPAIEWLEKQLQDYNAALLLVIHNRTFLQNVVNKIVEIDRGHLHEFEGSFRKFLDFREQQLTTEDRANKLFDKNLAQEEVWIRQGIKARRTRNEGRVRALEALRVERSECRELQGGAGFKLNNAESSEKIVAELDKISHSFGGQLVIRDFSTTVLRGDRIGIVGANGAGKSTLLKILLGKLTAQQGSVKLGSKLEVAYFYQLREHLNLEKNLIDNVSGDQEYIEINGQRKHVISYLGDFLFAPDRIRTPAKALSGGKQNRAILAKVFSKPANILVLDEPTNHHTVLVRLAQIVAGGLHAIVYEQRRIVLGPAVLSIVTGSAQTVCAMFPGTATDCLQRVVTGAPISFGRQAWTAGLIEYND